MKRGITKLQIAEFPPEENMIWKKWVDFKDRDENDLIGLLFSEINISFKKRALFILLAPSPAFLARTSNLIPLYWKNLNVGSFNSGSNHLSQLPLSLIDYAVSLIIEFATTIDWPQTSKEYRYARSFYNDCILTLLASLPDEDKLAEKIFPFFFLRSIPSYSGPEKTFDYGPFKKLLSADNISEKWKRLADLKMREFILSEIACAPKLREEWEPAFSCYSEIVQTQSSGRLTYSLDLFVEQIIFILDNCSYQKNLIKYWRFNRTFELLGADNYRDLRYRIARLIIFTPQEENVNFTVCSDLTFQIATRILAEFGPSDRELAQKLSPLIDDYLSKRAVNVAQNSAKQAAEADILCQMKLSPEKKHTGESN